MSTWAERVHRRAADIGSVVTSCGHPGSSASSTYPYRLEKVKFGVPLEEVCKKDNIPGPLLVLILKLNKESPYRRDIFRAPGHQGAMKKLIHFLQTGRLVNVANYSVYTIASVLKKFLRKIPNGIFGREGEEELFAINELQDETEQTQRLHRLFTSLPKYTQYLLVLLFGTFRVIASNAGKACTGMTSEALGVSVAPSFFQSCVSDGKTARMEDVLKFKVATKIMKNIIDKFATHDLFGRDNYEYYARVSGRILKVQDEWICSFQHPPPPRGKLAQQKYALQHSLEAEKTWLQCQCERWGLLAQEESRSTPALLTSSSSALDNSVLSLGVTPEHSFIESCARLSVSLEGPGLFAMTSSPLPNRKNHSDALNFEEDDSNYANNFIGGGDDDDADDDGDGDDDDDDDDDDEVDNENAFLPTHDENNPHHNLPIRYDLRVERKFHEKQHKTKKLVKDGGGGVGGGGGNADDDDDDDEGDATVVKRRFRQNRKKLSTAQMRVQHQRRLRVGTKSLDGERLQTTLQSTNDAAGILKNSNTDVDAKNYTLLMAKNANKSTTTTRTCSRCNRGIRHSSSCSSNSVAVGAAGTNSSGVGGGGGGGVGTAAATNNAGSGVIMGIVGNGQNGANGGGMTMDELRAVNRYAESTKSLSYLPQVRDEFLLASRISV